MESVTADAALSNPVSAENVTVTPGSAAFDESTTIAETVVAFELSDATVVRVELRLICATTDAVVVPVAVKPTRLLVMAVPLTVAVALTLSAPVAVPAFRVIVARPFASVSAVAPTGASTPNPVPVVLNVTTTPGSAAPALFFSVAVNVDAVVAEIAVAELLSVSVAAAVGVVVVVVVVDDPLPPPPHALSIANNAITKKDQTARDEKIFNLCSCCGGLRSCRS